MQERNADIEGLRFLMIISIAILHFTEDYWGGGMFGKGRISRCGFLFYSIWLLFDVALSEEKNNSI